VLVDVDHFKSYNDRYGHPAGDEALSRVARAIRSAARGGDGVHRIGGEEFAVLLAAGHAESLDVAHRIRRAVATVGQGRITVSAGVATAGDEDAQTLIDRADRALYRAKDRGRNRVDSHHTGSSPPVPRIRRCPSSCTG
jgi:diguanylate cyclase (GGDEF)-like protein